jgi:predicted phosphodiesterase
MSDLIFAVLADIHGNIWALDAVLADVDRRGIGEIVDLGDTVLGPLEPAATADRLAARGIPSLRGNGDRMILEPPAEPSASLAATLAALEPRHLAWLRPQPPTRILHGEILLCHGTPDSDETSLLEAISPQGARLRDDEAIRQSLGRVAQTLVLCAHTHIPRAVMLAGGPLIVNPGSVGLPAYDDDHPVPHLMEAGSPHARYAILARESGQWHVEHVLVPYDWARAAAVAEAKGRPDWAHPLRTGRVAR